MPEPLAVIEGVKVCADIAQMIYNICKDIHNFPQDVERIWQDFKVDRLVLQRYLDFFNDHERDVAEDIVDSISGITPTLQTALEDVARKLAHNQDGGIVRRLGWTFIKSKLETAELSLRKWVKITHLVLQALPQDPLRNDLERRFTSAQFSASHHYFGALLANLKMKERRLESSNASLGELRKRFAIDEPQSVDRNTRLRPDLIPIPKAFWGRQEEIDKAELEVAKLTSVLHESAARDMHIPSARSYFKQTLQSGNPQSVSSLAVVYETPDDLKSILTLEETILGLSQSPIVSLALHTFVITSWLII